MRQLYFVHGFAGDIIIAYHYAKKKISILISIVLLVTASIRGQCPPRDNLLNRIRFIKGSSKLSPQKQLSELLGYLDKMNNCPYRNDSTHVFLLRKIGDIYVQQADYLKAIQYRQQAIDIISANADKPSINIKTLPGNYYWLSAAYDSLNNFSEKMKALDSCFTIAIRLKHIDRSSLAALYTRVQYFFDVGDYQKCIDYATRCESLGQEYANDTTGAERKVGEGYTSSSLGWHANALLKLNKFERAEELLKNKIEEYSEEGLKDYLGMIYGQLALVNEQKGDYRKALSYYHQSLKYYQGIDNFNCKMTAKDIGNLYFKHFNDDEKAFAYYRKALKYINNDESATARDASESLNTFATIANVYVQKGHYDSARYYFQLAFNQLKPGINEMDVLHSSPEEMMRIKKIYYLAGLIIDKGDAYRKQYEATKEISALTEAIRIYKVADLFLNRIKTEQLDLYSKLFWRGDSRRLYENAINACYMNTNSKDAFYFFEKSRAVLLNDQLNEQRWVGERDILKQTQLQKRILLLEREFNSIGKSSIRYAEIQKEIFNNKQELDRLQKSIQISNPLYYQSFLDTSSVTLQDVQRNILKDHKALVELFVGDSAVYVLAITAEKSYLQKINKSDFDRLSDTYRNYISNQDLLNRNFDEFKNLSLKLYQLIFHNINLPAGRTIISPDGKYFPFEALVTNNQSATYFVEDHAVSYTYSARYLLTGFTSTSSQSARTFIGFAPVQFTGMRSLTGSDQSLHLMQNYFSNATRFVGSKASKNNFLQEFYKYKIIQLYTHATDSGSTGEPTIYFWDSPLLLSELLPENKPATSLIVLSACETASGKLYNGEGVFSFNRQFAALGIPSAVSNLWQVDNISTYKLTELFYKYVADGLPLDIALQRAKKEFIKSSDNKLPYFWAAPILVGKSNEISLQKAFPWKWLTSSVVILLILGFWGWKIRQKVFSTQFGVKRKLLHP